MAQYPNSANIDWTDSTVPGQGDELVDQQDVNFAEHVNEIRGEVKALAAELGSNPRGTQATVRARLENIESTKSATDHLHDSAYVRRDVLLVKGNLLTATAAGTPAVLAPGANGTVLMFDSGQTTGLRAKALDHGDDLGGLGDDDHPHYLNNARHDARDHSNVAGVPPYPFVGMVVDSARPDVPPLWLECNGQAVSRTTYAALFAAIDTTYGSGDGSTTFNLPDSRGRTRVGLDSTKTAYNAVGKTGGAETVALTVAQMPAHTHNGPSHSHTTSNHRHTGPSHSHSGPSHSHGSGTLSISGGSHAHSIETESNSDASHSHGSTTVVALGPSGNNPTSARGGIVNNAGHSHSVGGSTAASGTGSTGASGTGVTGWAGNDGTGNSGTGATSSAGSGNAHENMPPFLVLKSLIFAGA